MSNDVLHCFIAVVTGIAKGDIFFGFYHWIKGRFLCPVQYVLQVIFSIHSLEGSLFGIPGCPRAKILVRGTASGRLHEPGVVGKMFD